jgi:hypothetical protein
MSNYLWFRYITDLLRCLNQHQIVA